MFKRPTCGCLDASVDIILNGTPFSGKDEEYAIDSAGRHRAPEYLNFPFPGIFTSIRWRLTLSDFTNVYINAMRGTGFRLETTFIFYLIGDGARKSVFSIAVAEPGPPLPLLWCLRFVISHWPECARFYFPSKNYSGYLGRSQP